MMYSSHYSAHAAQHSTHNLFSPGGSSVAGCPSAVSRSSLLKVMNHSQLFLPVLTTIASEPATNLTLTGTRTIFSIQRIRLNFHPMIIRVNGVVSLSMLLHQQVSIMLI